MPSRVRIALCTAALALGAERLAFAQAPGQTGPSEYHAVPPLPEVLPSPRPTLPPPSRSTRGESVGGFITFGGGGFDTIIGADGSIRFDDNHIGGGIGINPLFGPFAVITFDITDEVMRWAGQDPYLTQKLRIMDSTREERMESRRRHDKVVMRRALDDLPS
jgi:hypothetical protein